MSNGNRVYQPDELWSAVVKCWNAFPLNVVARAYVRHSQIACAIAECQGGDDFVRERSGHHCNVRKCCVTICVEDDNPIGVEVVLSYEEEEDRAESVDGQRLRYNQPDLGHTLEENIARMEESELECLFEGLSSDHKWFEQVAREFSSHGEVVEE